MRLAPNPKLTESNQNLEFWIRGGAEKNPTGLFGLGLIKFGPAADML
jgi:hypothetical protein